MNSTTPRQSIGSFLRHEPLVHFVIGACILFLLQAFFAPDRREKILISKVTVDYLIEQEENLKLRPLTKDERQDAIALYVQDELLVREARKLGFENASRIRSLLIQNMRVFLTKDAPEINDKDLHTFFADNPEKFRVPERYSINHVSFKEPPAALDKVFDQLQNGADPATLGDEVPGLRAVIPGRSAAQLSMLFGPGIARKIVETEDGDWHGPMSSNYGVHFIQVTNRHSAKQMEFEDVAGSILPMAHNAATKRQVQSYVQGIKDNYVVELEEGVDKPGEAP